MKNRILLYALSAGMMLSSCNAFLDLEPESALSPEQYLTTEENLGAYATDLYNMFPEHERSTWGYWRSDANTDDMASAQPGDAFAPGYWRVEQTGGSYAFERIYRCNYFLNFVLPLEIVKEKSVRIGKERLRYSKEVSKKVHPFSKVERVEIELPEGMLEIRGEPFSAVFQDNRVYLPKNSKSPGTYTVHVHPQKSVRKKDQPTSAEFRYTFSFKGIKSVPLDLSKVANRGFRDDVADDGKGGWNDQGPQNDLRMFRPGDYRFFGVEFRVLDPEKNGGRSCIVLNGAKRTCFLDSATIDVSARGRWLYLLHANAFTGSYANSGYISVQFADGSTQEIPVRNKIDVGNWWGGIDWPDAPIVWKSANSSSVVGLYMTGFELKRDDPVKITFRKGEYPVWMIVAATLADRKAEMVRVREALRREMNEG